MRQLSDILKEKIKEMKSGAALGRALGGISGQTIGQYANGAIPSFDIAIKWKQAFDENLIDLMFVDEPSTVSKPEEKYKRASEELAEVQRKLINCMEEKEQLKNFVPYHPRKSKLK